MSSAKTVKTSDNKAANEPSAPVKSPLIRGEVVVQKVLEAAIHELAAVGYQGFRMEEVASRAEVNKTTVYRRWPTKSELVRDALYMAAAQKNVLTDTGSIRSDLFKLGQSFAANATSPKGQSIFRMLAAEGADPELAEIVKSLRDRNLARAKVVIDDAITRGELAPGVDHIILLHAFMGAVHHRIFMMREPVNDAYLTALIDLLLLGATRPHVQSSAIEDVDARNG